MRRAALGVVVLAAVVVAAILACGPSQETAPPVSSRTTAVSASGPTREAAEGVRRAVRGDADGQAIRVETDLRVTPAEGDRRAAAIDAAAESQRDAAESQGRVSQSQAGNASSESTAVIQQQPSAERFAAIEREMAQNMLAKDGDQFVERMTALGLAPSDSETIVQQAFEGMASCTVEALWSAAEEASVPFDEVLDAAAAALFDADGPMLTSMVDVRAVETRALPCVLSELQQAGIPLQ